jgi:uncharacterized protein YecT (DUF1311 family)
MEPFLFAALLAAVLQPAAAENASARIKKDLNACLGAAHSTKDQVECYESRSDSLDAAMNDLYKKTLQRLDPDQKKLMREAQRSWVQFRDKETAASNAIYARIQGTIRRQYGADKTYRLIEKRLEELEETLSVIVNDLGKE